MLSPKKLLENARNRIAKRENWTRGYMARTEFGQLVDPIDPKACQWCMMGALGAEAGYNMNESYGDKLDTHPHYREAVSALKEASPTGGTWSFNDMSSHEQVLAVFDKAIANMKGE